MKRGFKKYINSLPKIKEVTLDDFKSILLYKNKHDLIRLKIDGRLYEFTDTSVSFGIMDDNEYPEWMHHFLSLENGRVVSQRDNSLLVSEYLKDVRINLKDLLLNSITNKANEPNIIMI